MKTKVRVFGLILAVIVAITSLPQNAYAAGIRLNETKATIAVGESKELWVTGTAQKAEWSSSNAKIASVDANGLVVGKKIGSTKITAKIGEAKYSCKVTVKACLDYDKISLIKGKSKTLKLKGAKAVNFASSKPSVATVSKKGKISAKKKGSTTITVTDSKKKKYKCKVTVEDPSLSKTKLSMFAGGETKLKLKGTKQEIKWSSANKKVATVDETGKVTAVSKGKASIRAKVGGATFTCKMEVKVPTAKLMRNQSKKDKKVFMTLKGNSDGTFKVPAKNPKRKGYTFYGWYNEKDCKTPYIFENDKDGKDIVLYAKWAKDTDADGLSDAEEKTYKTDIKKKDTDGDGLNDYQEVYLTGTDPLYADYFQGDMDGDGLTDVLEVTKYKTDMRLADTDGDGINDGAEVLTYKTNPSLMDTDGDTLADGFEISVSLNPNKKKTDGKTPDAKRKFQQTLSDKGISKELLKDNAAKPSVSGLVSGDLSERIFISSAKDDMIKETRSVVGEPVEINADKGALKGTTLSFDLPEGKDTAGMTICELKEDGTYGVVSSTVTEAGDISCNLKKEGTYFVVDAEKLVSGLGIDLSAYEPAPATAVSEALEREVTDWIDESVAEQESVNQGDAQDDAQESELIEEDSNNDITQIVEEEVLGSAGYDEIKETISKKLAGGVSGQADIAFVVDTTGSMGSYIRNVVKNITAFTSALSENYNVKVNYALVDFKDITCDGDDSTKVVKNHGSNWFTTAGEFNEMLSARTVSGGGDGPETDVDALETARNLDFRSTASKFIILVTDASCKLDNNYGIKDLQQETDLLKKEGIITSVVSKSYLEEEYRCLYQDTRGIFADISEDFSTVLMELAKLIGEQTSDGEWLILKHGYRYIKLPAIPVAGSTADTDMDGITDYEEIGKPEEIDISPFIARALAAKGIPSSVYKGATTITVYDASSDPSMDDSDMDGIKDKEDTAPWTLGLEGGVVGTLTILSNTDKAASIIGLKTGGHSFFVLNSYVDNVLDFSGLYAGWTTSTGSYKDASRQTSSIYDVSVGEKVAIGNGGVSISDAGVCYNLEFYKYFANGYTYTPNSYMTKDITEEQLEDLIEYCSGEDVNYYSLALHNCSSVAADAWNHIYDDDLKAATLTGGLGFIDTPTGLASNISKKSGSAKGYKIGDFLK